MEESKNIGEKVVDQLSGTGESDREFEEWLAASGSNRDAYGDYKRIWEGTTALAFARRFRPETAWRKLDRQLAGITKTNRQVCRLRYTLIGMAASVLLLLGFTFYDNWFSLSPGEIGIVTANGNRSEMVLPDGTQVKLNGGSNLQYRFNKLNKTREVKFNGEAYFDVAKSHSPFVILSDDGMELKVLGTRFNYSDYSDDHEIKTTLLEGKIELFTGSGESFLMLPGQVASFDKKSKRIELLKENPSHSYGWLEDKLYMDNMSLNEVCVKLERRYDVEMNCEPSDLGKNIHYTGVLQEETIVAVLDALCELSAIQYGMKGKRILITKK